MLRDRIAEMTAAANDPQTKLTEVFGTTQTDEQIVPIIDGLINDNQGQYQVNVPNQGTITGIPDDVVVEVLAVVSKKGIQPIHVGELPPKLMIEALLPHWLDMERNLLAFKTGDRSILLWNTLDSHQTRSFDQARAVMEDLLAMEGHEEMNAHFTWPSNW